MTLASFAYYLVDMGTVTTAIAFVALVAHTSLLAFGRRAIAVGARPAAVGAGASGGTATVTIGSGTSSTLTGISETAAGNTGQVFVWLSFILIGLGMLIRAYIVGRGPWGNLYEFSVAFAFGILRRLPLPVSRRYPISAIGFIPIGVALFLLGYAFTLPQEISPLVPALDNPPLITIHVAMAMISYGIFAVSFGAAVGYLIQGKENRVSWLPPAKVLDEVAYRAVIIGFPIFATLIILGSYWASIAWGRYWGWDPKETSALVTWLIYAVYLHARSQRGWAGRPAALILVIGFVRRDVHVPRRQPVLRRPAPLQRASVSRGAISGSAANWHPDRRRRRPGPELGHQERRLQRDRDRLRGHRHPPRLGRPDSHGARPRPLDGGRLTPTTSDRWTGTTRARSTEPAARCSTPRAPTHRRMKADRLPAHMTPDPDAAPIPLRRRPLRPDAARARQHRVPGPRLPGHDRRRRHAVLLARSWIGRACR